MGLLKIIGGVIVFIGACITLTSPFILLIGLGMLGDDFNTILGVNLTQTAGIVTAVVVFVIGAIVAVVGKVIMERD